MKSLDIDSVNTGSDDYRNQPVKIEFMGGLQKGRAQGAIQTVTVAYSSLSKKLQSIHRLGGKIINVSIPRFQTEHVDTEHIASDISANMPEITQSLEPVVEVNVESNTVEITQDPNAIDLAPVKVIPEAETVAEVVAIASADFETETISEAATQDADEVIESVIDPEIISEEVSAIASEEITDNLAEPETTSAKTGEVIEETVNIPKTPEAVYTKIETDESKAEHLETTSVVTEVITEVVSEQKTISPQKSKPIALTSKPKKSRTSAKSHGFNKRETKPTSHEPVVEQVVEQDIAKQDVIPELAIETAPILAEPLISNTVADVVTETVVAPDLENSEPVIAPEETSAKVVAETFTPEVLDNHIETEETVAKIDEAIVEAAVKTDEASEIKVDTVVNEQLQHEETVLETKPESDLEQSQIDISATVEPLVEDIPAIATETISASIPQVEAATSLAKPKKSKTASKGFNKPKSPNSSTSRSPRK